MALLLLAACREPLYIEPEPEPEPEPVTCPGEGGVVADLDAMDPPSTVVVFVADTARRDYMGRVHPEWDTTPRLDALIAEATGFDRVLSPRGLTSVSMTSFLTGAYPRTHGVRSNDGLAPVEGTSVMHADFQAAGYRTYGLSTNQCELIDLGIDERWCHSVDDDPDIDQEVADAEVLPEFFARLDARPAGEPTYAYLHLIDPHDPYDPRSPYFEAFHPEPYDGPLLAPISWDTMIAVQNGDIEVDDADRRYLDAVYASQVRKTDDHFAALLDGLEARGRLEDAVVVYVMDHGEEILDRSGYFGHACSTFNIVMEVSAVVYAPGRLPGGALRGGWASLADIAPTVLDLARVPRGGIGEGVSRLAELQQCVDPTDPVYFERGTSTAGIILGDDKYVLDPDEEYTDCKGFDSRNPYVGPARQLYDLAADPYEWDNLVDAEPDRAATLEAELCAWVNDGTWARNEDPSNNSLLAACAAR